MSGGGGVMQPFIIWNPNRIWTSKNVVRNIWMYVCMDDKWYLIGIEMQIYCLQNETNIFSKNERSFATHGLVSLHPRDTLSGHIWNPIVWSCQIMFKFVSILSETIECIEGRQVVFVREVLSSKWNQHFLQKWKKSCHTLWSCQFLSMKYSVRNNCKYR